MNAIQQIFRAITPHGLVEARRARLAKSTPNVPGDTRAEFHAERRQRIAGVATSPSTGVIQGDDCGQTLAFLKARGLPEADLLVGSMAQPSLEYIRERAILPLDAVGPLTALHIGNFVGVSLAFLAAALRQRHPDSLVVSIDPNLAHRGIRNPQAHVAALLAACGLQRNTMIIAGYSGRKSISNDGVVFKGYDPVQEFAGEYACENTLQNLKALCPKTFDVVLMDGNHEGSYLTGELQAALPLLKPGGVVILDDVNAAWTEIREVFSQIATFGLEPIGTDGRVGLARLIKERADAKT